MASDAFIIEGQDRSGRWLVTCDHATNNVPHWINNGDLGLPPTDMERHIAFDVGAAGVTQHLATALRSPAIYSQFSRLVIDPNRGADDPTLVMKLYDGTIIPANRHADQAEVERRKKTLYRPYHDAYAMLASRQSDTAICAVHSFTPQLRGRAKRPWEIGVLYASDERLANPFMDACRAQGWPVGDNEPYVGHLQGDSIDQHGLQHGRPNILIELRSDLIETEQNQIKWANTLAPMLEQSLAAAGL